MLKEKPNTLDRNLGAKETNNKREREGGKGEGKGKIKVSVDKGECAGLEVYGVVSSPVRGVVVWARSGAHCRAAGSASGV